MRLTKIAAIISVLLFSTEARSDSIGFCKQIPSCSSLGYITPADNCPNNIEALKCPFNDNWVYCPKDCREYTFDACDSSIGTCDQCAKDGKWKYEKNSCISGYTWKDGQCIEAICSETEYPFTTPPSNTKGDYLVCTPKSGITRYAYGNCVEGYYLQNGNCLENPCPDAHLIDECPRYATSCEDCQSGNKIMKTITCDTENGYKFNGDILKCTKYQIGDIYYHNSTPVGVVFYADEITTKIIALKNVDSTGKESNTAFQWGPNGDIEGMVYSNTTADAANYINGKSNTDLIAAFCTEQNRSNCAAQATLKYAPSVCSEGSPCAKGNWYLPAQGELEAISKNKDTLNNKLTAAGGVVFSCDNSEGAYHWSSTVISSEYAGRMNICLGLEKSFLRNDRSKISLVRPILMISE